MHVPLRVPCGVRQLKYVFWILGDMVFDFVCFVRYHICI